MTSASAIAIWAYDLTAKAVNQARVDWLIEQRDALVSKQFGGGNAASSIISATGNSKTTEFQIDLSGPDKLERITEALVSLGVIPAFLLPVTTTYGAWANLER